MISGRSRTLVSIQQRNEDSIDSLGDPVVTWSEFKKEWGYVTTQSGREFLNAKEQHSSLTHIVTTRFIDSVTPDMRVSTNGSVFNILAAFDPLSTRRELKIYCNEQL